METLLASTVFALFLAAQILAVIVVSREYMANRAGHPAEPARHAEPTALAVRSLRRRQRTIAAPCRSTVAASSTMRSITSRADGMSRTRSTPSPAQTTR